MTTPLWVLTGSVGGTGVVVTSSGKVVITGCNVVTDGRVGTVVGRYTTGVVGSVVGLGCTRGKICGHLPLNLWWCLTGGKKTLNGWW
jgi:hypothetical protein